MPGLSTREIHNSHVEIAYLTTSRSWLFHSLNPLYIYWSRQTRVFQRLMSLLFKLILCFIPDTRRISKLCTSSIQPISSSFSGESFAPLSGEMVNNSLWPAGPKWHWRSWSTLVQIMAWCLMAPIIHYLNQCKICWKIFFFFKVQPHFLRASSQFAEINWVSGWGVGGGVI